MGCRAVALAKSLTYFFKKINHLNIISYFFIMNVNEPRKRKIRESLKVS